MNRPELMARIRSRGTRPEDAFQGIYPMAEAHPDWLPLHPDFLFLQRAVFIDSGFWHLDGCRRRSFDRLSDWWQLKLIRNYCRDLSRDSFYGDHAVVVDDRDLLKYQTDGNGDRSGLSFSEARLFP